MCIRQKVISMGCYFPPAGTDGGSAATCRPGGGQAGDGRNASRNDPLIQRADVRSSMV